MDRIHLGQSSTYQMFLQAAILLITWEPRWTGKLWLAADCSPFSKRRILLSTGIPVILTTQSLLTATGLC